MPRDDPSTANQGYGTQVWLVWYGRNVDHWQGKSEAQDLDLDMHTDSGLNVTVEACACISCADSEGQNLTNPFLRPDLKTIGRTHDRQRE